MAKTKTTYRANYQVPGAWRERLLALREWIEEHDPAPTGTTTESHLWRVVAQRGLETIEKEAIR